MDVKLNQTRIADNSTGRSVKRMRLFEFIQELKNELKKVSWTTKDELKFSTKAVIGTTFVLGLGIYIVDLFVKGFLDGISTLVRYVFG